MADVIPFIPPALRAEVEAMHARLASCEDALLRASDAIRELQTRLETEKVMKDFYQDLATRRLSRIIELENSDGQARRDFIGTDGGV